MGITKGIKSYTKDEMKIFKEGLSKEIFDRVEKYGSCLLSVDYSPCEIFMEVEEETGIKIASYPWKTSMNILKDEVKVYQSGESKVIWSNKNIKLELKK